MNTTYYWEKCRLYRLPDKIVQKNKLEPHSWTYLIPTSANSEQLGSFPILSVIQKKRHEIKNIYDNNQIKMHNKNGAEQDLYWLFTLGDPLLNMPRLKDIMKKNVVLISESTESA